MKKSTGLLFAAIFAFAIPNSPVRGQEFIIGGDDAAPGDYPWTVALVSRGSTDLFQGQFCGGSLIDPYWVVTAAHCVDDRSAASLEIWANITDLSNPEAAAERRTVRAIYIHPSYDASTFDGDIALLLLDSPVNTVTPIAYAASSGAAVPGNTARVTGWGQTQVSPPQFPTTLQYADLSILSNAAGNSAYGRSFDSRFLVAGFNGADTCFGDSGGPIFDPFDAGVGGPLLLGVTSFGLGCPAETSTPGIYTNVGAFAPWLNLFLAQPTGPDPGLSILGKSSAIANGSRSTSKANGTNFGKRIKAGKKKTQTYILSNSTGSIPLSVQHVNVTGKGFTLRSVPPNYVIQGIPDSFRVRLKAPRSKKKRRLRGTVIVQTNDVTAPVFTFRVEGKTKKKKRRRIPFRLF